MLIYEEYASRSADNSYYALHVLLFKLVAEHPLRRWTVYLRVEHYETYAPEAAHPTVKHLTHPYVGGPDSKRIRAAIALVDGFERKS